MPRLVIVNAAGSSQRRLLSEVVKDLKSQGYVLASRQEGGGWSDLFGDSRTAGLFESRTIVQVEDAAKMGRFPDEFVGFLEGPEAFAAIVLVYSSDASKFFAKDLFKKLDVRKAQEVPRWSGQRQKWISDEGRKLGVRVSSEASALLADWIEDGEELRGELEKLALVAPEGGIDGELVRQLTVDEGGKNLLNLLDGLCYGKHVQVIQALESLRRGGIFLMVVVSLHNRFRLAMYQRSGNAGSGLVNALGAKPYQKKMASEAARRYDLGALQSFTAALIRLSLAEKTGQGQGWNGLFREVLEFMGTVKP